MRNFLICPLQCQCEGGPPGVCSVLTSPRVSVLLLLLPHLSVSPLSSAPLGGLGPRPGYLLLALRSQLVTSHRTPIRVIGESAAGHRDNRTFKHDIYRKSFIEFCKNHQFRKLKEKIVFLSTQFK